MPKATTPAQYVLILIDLVESQGHDRETLLRGTTLAETGISGIGARVSETDYAQLVENAFELTRDPALGLHLGLRLNLSAHAVLGQVMKAWPSTACALRLSRRPRCNPSAGARVRSNAFSTRCA